ncbi:MAG: 5-methyltetrahydropteroyltriglutamate--homocysteine S-methyltransferase [Betaproteobacteria bacterium]|jgi:5-methyltetrahydropteroyltriglutamate--homocysteine methyltransferase|nr:MAG: 5-methyltetrahydropteroyltriglutamate--homocysteine S-methyltransferase [Betaproteobacteria bacterium]TMH83889.1 MAG: 5-methyltetrahydropteroyltriglutamate--homocysteine S-methyltransferase [Betaproteobacteria bacterium]
MTQRKTPPFRADHVGSLLRPAELHEARAKAKRGEISADALRALQDKHIREAVAKQESVGMQLVTDGEFRRDWWHIDFIHGFDGVELAAGDAYGDAKFKNTEEQPPFMTVKSRIRRTKPSMLEHFKFLKSVAKHTPKFTMPSPAMLHARGDRASLRKTYPELEEFWADLTQAYREEIADLYKAGCRYLQIDDTTIAMWGDPKVQEQFRKLGDDPKRDAAMYADAVNAAIRDVPEDMTVAIHTCRGNFKSTWLASGAYADFVAERVFTGLDVDAFFLEYDTERAGGFEPLRYVPKGKTVVLGLVSSKVPELEKKDELRRRIDAAAKFVPLENLCLSPQCGFSSTHHGNKLTADDQWRKLGLVLEVSKSVWG